MNKSNAEYYVLAKDADYVKVDEKDLEGNFTVDSLVYLVDKQYLIKKIVVANAIEGKIVFECERLE